MRLNKYIASSSTLSRRAADVAIDAGRVTVDDHTAQKGTEVTDTSQVKLDGAILTLRTQNSTLILHKPVGYVCSRNGQGSRTIFELLPPEYQHLQPVGRLDKDSSGLLLLTDDGSLANQLTHPRYTKTKVYEVTLDKPLAPLHQQLITDHGIGLEDGLSRFSIQTIENPRAQHRCKRIASGGVEAVFNQSDESTSRGVSPSLKTSVIPAYQITMQEGRNRQIRRTLKALGYSVTTLHRTHFGSYVLAETKQGQWKKVA